jgi:2-amino-1-hydroxyethylphosphonate dioxygenase (glycine-forming)
MIDYQLKRASAILEQFQEMDYIGEEVSQFEHAMQCAYFAKKNGHDEHVIIASLLHDIGHVALSSLQPEMDGLGVINHEWIGAKLVREMGFSQKVSLLIGHHVNAKRYLAAKKPRYHQRLSHASKGTLAFQGGPMSPQEMLEFETLPFFREILQVRVNDEKGKVDDFELPSLDYFQQLMKCHLEQNNDGFNLQEKKIFVLIVNHMPEKLDQILKKNHIDLALSQQRQALNSTVIYDYNLTQDALLQDAKSHIEETMEMVNKSTLSRYLLHTNNAWYQKAIEYYPDIHFQSITNEKNNI